MSEPQRLKDNMRRILGAALTLLALIGRPAHGQNRADTVVLRIEGPAGGTARVSGTIRLRDGEEERTYSDVRTPFEIRLPAQALEARFGVPLGVRLSGEMTLLREGKQVGWVTGTSRFGSLRFYRTDTGAYGFGSTITSAFRSPLSLQTTRLNPFARFFDAGTPCVRTAPMPSLKLSSADSMPVREQDSASVPRMPVARAIPCYQVDSIR